MTYHGHSSSVEAARWSPDGKRIVSGGDDMAVQIWDAVTGGHVLTCRGHTDVVDTVAGADGKHVVWGSLDRTAQVWDAATGNHILTYRGHTGLAAGVVLAVVWSPDGEHIASGSADTTVQIWNPIT